MPTKDFREVLLDDLKDPAEALAYIQAALNENHLPTLMLALRDVVDAQGFTIISKKAGLNRENLYRFLDENGNPKFETILKLVSALGLKLGVEKSQPDQSFTFDNLDIISVEKTDFSPSKKTLAQYETLAFAA